MPSSSQLLEIMPHISNTSQLLNKNMQIHRVIDEVNGISRSTVTGEISLIALQTEIRRVMSEPSYNPHLPALVDVRQATSCMTTDEIVILAEAMRSRRELRSGARHALLVNAELMRGLYRMFHSFSEGGPIQYRMFESEEEAKQWLVGTDS